jgi:transposase
VWAKKGTKPTLLINGSYAKLNVFGFINPLTGQSHFQYIKNLDSDCFIQFLKAILKEYARSRKIYLIIDNAPAHKSKKVSKFLLSFTNKLELVCLPPYSPDLNPIEILWREVKKDVVYNTFYRYFDDFQCSLTQSLKFFAPNRIISICGIDKYRQEVLAN